tara:strand:+ start:142 stop:480 length:339 start_codon:yes stop_codon:yes gene_type:complete
MASRYEGNAIITNDFDIYKTVFEKRGVKKIQHYVNNFINQITPEQRSELQIIDHVWRRGDHFYKLAFLYYGDPTYWWVIASYNKTPTEANLKFGNLVFIPTPLETILTFYGV